MITLDGHRLSSLYRAPIIGDRGEAELSSP